MSLLDKSLDDLITKKEKRSPNQPSRGRGANKGGAVRNSDRNAGRTQTQTRSQNTTRGGGRGGGGNRGGSGNGERRGNRNLDSQWTHNAFTEDAAPTTSSGEKVGTKVKISSLRFDVLEEELKELFGRVGTVHSATVHYDNTGRSKGEASVIFIKHSDAQRAIREYNGRKIDGQAMEITDAGTVIIGHRQPRQQAILIADEPVRGRETGGLRSQHLQQIQRQQQQPQIQRRHQQQEEEEDLDLNEDLNFRISVQY